MSLTLDEVDQDIRELLSPYEDHTDGKNHKTHIVNPPNNTHIWKPGMTAQDIVLIARLQNLEVTALCGYTWVPKANPEKYDVCEECMKLAGDLLRDAGE